MIHIIGPEESIGRRSGLIVGKDDEAVYFVILSIWMPWFATKSFTFDNGAVSARRRTALNAWVCWWRYGSGPRLSAAVNILPR